MDNSEIQKEILRVNLETQRMKAEFEQKCRELRSLFSSKEEVQAVFCKLKAEVAKKQALKHTN